VSGPLEGKTAVVTGASSGIGAATARQLAEAGAKVVLGARRKDRLDTLAEEIGADAVAAELDVGDEQSVRSFFEHLDGVDVLVNNAGVMLLGPVDGADTSEWRRMVDVNLLGLLYCTHAALPSMRERGGGDIVNISSVAGRFANAGNAVYAMTKFGVGAFSESLRKETVAAGIRVTLIEPGFVDTELQGHNENPVVRQAIDSMREEIGEILHADDIAQAILYAVSRPRHVSVNEVLVRPSGQSR
jgi:clavulanate-9-aldehyde reducatase